ncbi:hypothetical protein P154DRAFT_502073 [Amniculicola lignicola CBS 123094]|uniref:Uncharacterized protein n=1 Tax=Amniculicola lignicola CBS 123094 TaxID=1392246 RepID=A0A6A5W056_9PLEO|nr:hypothetical protein P154DRAFT_502073 [Amniculicola lignicola CBS 123094]
MPHKHRRKITDVKSDDAHFNLPPTVRAKPLPVGTARASSHGTGKKRKSAMVEGYGADDTPKGFARLMQFQAGGKVRNGLDDGARPKTKKRKVEDVQPTDTVDSEAQPLPKIQPGEKLSDFGQRVNQALPLGSVGKRGKKVDGSNGHRVTKHEKRLKKLQKGWREEEVRIRDKEQEERELAEEERDEIDAMWEDKTSDLPAPGKKSKRKGKKRLVAGEVEDVEEDEWEALRRTRDERKGLHDVAQEPPQFLKVPREIFKVKNGARVNVANIPNAVGSLRKREELGEQRQGIIDTYRELMAARKEGIQT